MDLGKGDVTQRRGILPVSGPQGQSLQVEVQPLVPGCLQRPGTGAVLGGIRPMVGRRGQHPPYCRVLHCAATKSYTGGVHFYLFICKYMYSILSHLQVC